MKRDTPEIKAVLVDQQAPSVMSAPPTKQETPGVKSFFSRYWQFVVCGAVFLGFVLNDSVFKWVGALTYLPLLAFGVFILAFIFRFMLNKTTTDAYIHADAYETDFASLPAIHKVWLTQVQFLVYIIVIALLASKVLGDNPPPRETFIPTNTWQTELDASIIRPEWNARLDVITAGIVRDRERYLEIEHQRVGGMPWYFVAGLHERESSRNFTRHLHEGSPLIHRTFYVPKGRLPNKPPPYLFEESAEDALYVLEHENWVNWYDQVETLNAIEAYNGLGYRHRDVPSPYLWSGTTRYSRGKYVADGRYSAISVDQQAGVITIWLRMRQRGYL